MDSSQQNVPKDDLASLAVYYDFPAGTAVSQKDFEFLLGRSVPPNQGPQKGEYTINTPISEMRDSFIGRQLFSFLEKQLAKMVEGQEDTVTALLFDAMAQEIPLRSLLMLGDGSITRKMLDALLLIINGKLLKGLFAFLKSYLEK